MTTTKEKEVVVSKGARQTVYAALAADLDVESTPGPQVSRDIQDKAQGFIDDYIASLVERTEARVQALTARRPRPKDGAMPLAGEPTVGNFPYWDLFTVGPVQFIGPPPWRPSKIIASGELALVLAVLFINPLNAPGPAPAPTIQLGARGFRIRFEGIDLTNVADGPDFTDVGVFPPVAPAISVFPHFFIAPDPGVNPMLVELNCTADITVPGQPFAAFSTNHLDIDSEPPFLIVPGTPPQLQHDIPMRYLVYRL